MLDRDARLALAGTRFADVRHLAEVGSTNREVAALARQGAPEGVVVVADHQTRGRGRRGRSWESPPGSSLLVSVLLRPATPHVAAMATGLAARQACAEVAGAAASLKWPNDVLAGAGKLGGILAEVVGDAVVVGLGVNVGWHTPLPAGAVDLRRLGGRPVDRGQLLVAFLLALEDRSRQPGEAVLAEYRARCATVGRPVRVALGTERIVGTASDVDDHGRLVVDTHSGRWVIDAGDVVHLR